MNYPCWSKTEDEDLRNGYARAMEVEDGDKATLSIEGVSDVTNAPVVTKDNDEKPYTDADKEDAQDLF